MGNRFAKPNRKPVRQEDIILIPSQKLSTENKQDGPSVRNRSTQWYGIANDLPKDDIYSLKSNNVFKVGTRKIRPSRIPVAAWRSNIAPEPKPLVVNKPGRKELTNQCKELDGCSNNSDICEEHSSPSDEQCGISGGVKVRKGISYTIVIHEHDRNTSPLKPKPVYQPQTNKAVYNQIDRFQMAEINRKQYLQNKVQKARLYDLRRQDNTQRRLAVSAEQREKFLAKQKYREKAVIREEIHKRLDSFKNNIKKVRFFRPDKESD